MERRAHASLSNQQGIFVRSRPPTAPQNSFEPHTCRPQEDKRPGQDVDGEGRDEGRLTERPLHRGHFQSFTPDFRWVPSGGGSR